MVARRTLNLYFTRVFLRSILNVFLICFAIIFLVDLVEQIREFSSHADFSFMFAVKMALYRTPTIAEQILPFAVLIGAIVAFLSLTRKLELAVTRSAGVSVWQFMQPALFVAVLIGAFASAAYNPLAVWLQQRSELLELREMSDGKEFSKSATKSVWFRQEGSRGESYSLCKTHSQPRFDPDRGHGSGVRKRPLFQGTGRCGFGKLERWLLASK